MELINRFFEEIQASSIRFLHISSRIVLNHQKKSRLVLILSLACFIVFILLILFRGELARIFSRTSSSQSLINQTEDSFIGTSSTNSDSQPKSSSVFSDESTVSSKDTDEKSNSSNLTFEKSPSTETLIVTGRGPVKIGVVDMERLAVAYPLETDSKAAKEKATADLKRAVSVRAAARGFTVIFDTSGKTFNGVPVVLATNGVPDITDEVLQDLSR